MTPEDLKIYAYKKNLVHMLLEACEQTGQFPFRSRHFLRVNETTIAAEGLFRFIEGNPDFKATIPAETLAIINEFVGDDPTGLSPFRWSIN